MKIEDTPYVKDMLDGFGSGLKGPFADEVRKMNRRFRYAFEWCSGIGEIGMNILRQDLCTRLCISDINPEAIRIARQIAERDSLTDKIDILLGDNLAPVPKDAKFDLIVGNPPNYYNVQKAHPFGKRFFHDLRPNDRGWKIHEAFYTSIRHYLSDDGVILLHEVEPYKTEVYIKAPGEYDGPYDVRDEVPLQTFERMAAQGDLKIDSVSKIMDVAGTGLYMLKIIPA